MSSSSMETLVLQAEALSDDDPGTLTSLARKLRFEVLAQDQTGKFDSELVARVFALVRKASRLELKQNHYPVQLEAGVELVRGRIVEMQTGEGKTLTASLPAVYWGMTGRGVHILTVNDYLARRDAELMKPVYARLGLTTGCLQSNQPEYSQERKAQYDCDITYGTVKEFGFDFLRDRLTLLGTRPLRESSQHRVTIQRPLAFALVDEADSILLDEARTPLIINSPQPADERWLALYEFASSLVPQLQIEREYRFEPDRKQVWLTNAGVDRVLQFPRKPILRGFDQEKLLKQVEQAITAEVAMRREKDYVIQTNEGNSEVMLIDESTGRPMEGRQWTEGLHQAVEIKEHLPPTPQTGEAAKTTIYSLMKQYRTTAGMTGTASQATRELKRLYRKNVSVIPTHRPCRRSELPTRIFSTLQAKYAAILQSIQELLTLRRAVLVGTSTIQASEALSELLRDSHIDHEVLNAWYLEREARIVAGAGQPGSVVIATNMAGRGTDIKLGPGVEDQGGLHVIATEMHDSPRIDRQLIGRAARQGDRGSFQFLLSLEDELMKAAGQVSKSDQKLLQKNRELPATYLKLFERSQQFLEKQHRKDRKKSLKEEKKRLKTARELCVDPFTEFLG